LHVSNPWSRLLAGGPSKTNGKSVRLFVLQNIQSVFAEIPNYLPVYVPEELLQPLKAGRGL